MKRILVLIPLYCMTFLNANVLDNSVDHVKEELTEYRVYPRLQKADNYIAEGKIKEAKELLLKVLEIDPKNAKAGSRVVALCMQDKDFECANRYVGFVESPTYAKYYQGYISFQLKHYDKALKAATSIDDPTTLKKSEQELNNHIILRSAIMSENEEATHTYLEKILHPKYNTASCPSESLEIITLLFEHKLFDAASKETGFYVEHCKSKKIPDEKLAIWSDLLRKEKLFGQEESIIAYMSDVGLKNEHTLSMYLNSGDETKAIETMEKIYHAQPSDKNKARLVYLYENAKMQDKIIMLYSEVYEFKKNPEDLRTLLYLKKEPKKQYQILEKYYPYAGLTDEEKFNFSVSLIKFYKTENKVDKVLSIVDDLTHLENLTDKQKLYLSHQYSDYHQDQKAIALMEALYQSDPLPEYKERLEYLHNKNTISKKAQPKAVQKKPKIKPMPTREDKLRSETQLAYDLIHEKRYDEASVHIKKALQYEPNNAVRYEQLGQVYYAQEKYEEAADAFKKASVLAPKSGYYESLGYCQIKLKEKKSAIESFKKSIDIVKQEEPENIDKLYQLKYSVAELDRDFFGYLTYGMRLDSYHNSGGISPILSANYGGFSALELHYKPEEFDDYATVYVKALAGVRDQSLAIRSETWQPS